MTNPPTALNDALARVTRLSESIGAAAAANDHLMVRVLTPYLLNAESDLAYAYAQVRIAGVPVVNAA